MKWYIYIYPYRILTQTGLVYCVIFQLAQSDKDFSSVRAIGYDPWSRSRLPADIKIGAHWVGSCTLAVWHSGWSAWTLQDNYNYSDFRVQTCMLELNFEFTLLTSDIWQSFCCLEMVLKNEWKIRPLESRDPLFHPREDLKRNIFHCFTRNHATIVYNGSLLTTHCWT